MKLPAHKPLALALLLGGMAFIGLSLVSLVFYTSENKIKQNQQNALLFAIHQVLAQQRYDNNPLADSYSVVHPLLGNKQAQTVYTIKHHGQVTATVVTCSANDGYNGTIQLIVAIQTSGELIGVRVINHQETPGLGDKIDHHRSDWIDVFNQHSLMQPQAPQWAVKRDGGAFDQLTGATITSRAVVNAVKNALYYAQTHTTDVK